MLRIPSKNARDQKLYYILHDDVIDTINDPSFSMITHEFEKMTQIDAWMISIHVKVFHDDEILRKFPEDNNS